MNRSGAAIAPLRALAGFDPADAPADPADDVALPVGKFRLRGAGSAGGHNGLKSVEAALQRQDFFRLRIGVGPVPVGMGGISPTSSWGRFEAEENQSDSRDLLDPMAEAVESWLGEGIERAMSRFNR